MFLPAGSSRRNTVGLQLHLTFKTLRSLRVSFVLPAFIFAEVKGSPRPPPKRVTE